MLVISIVPRLYPAIDGVGDYALSLARQLRKDFGIETHFICGDPSWTGTTSIEGFSISRVTHRSTDNLLSLLLDRDKISTSVLLHYVGHGYVRRGGCPFWLVEGLEHWQKSVANTYLVTMFHELYASGGPIWRSDFWFSSLQKALASRVAQMSDRCLTNTQSSAKTLYKLSRGKHEGIPILPVFSSMGEPKTLLPLSQRLRRLVVFGQKGSRLRVYQESLAGINRVCQILEIEEIWDIGQPIALDLVSVERVPILEIGQRSALEISEIMSNSLVGFFNYYDIDRLAKSTIFAAYCAHGLVPVSDRFYPFSVDGIKAGKHYWIPDWQHKMPNSLKELQAIADNAYNWYQTHKLSIQAKTFAASIVTEFSHQN
jgi:hypothetical protein